MFKKGIHYSPDLETSILGACLLEQSAFARVFGIITAENFYVSYHKEIFSYLEEMFEINIPIDLLTATDFITRKKQVEKFGDAGAAYFLTRLTNVITNTSQIEYYAFCMKEMWIEREIITLTHSGVKGHDSREEIYKLQKKLSELSETQASGEWKDMSELMIDLYRHQDEMTKTKGAGLITGIPTIDRLYGGFFGGQMIIIGARPSIGKSAVAGQLAMNMATNGKKVGFISLEMNNNEIAARLASIDTQMGFNEIYRSLYTDENQRESFYKRVSSSTATLPIYVSDKADLSVTDIKAKAYKLLHKNGLDCLIVDYLQLVDGEGSQTRTRENEVAKISRGLKITAKELNIPLVVICQLNREVEKRKGKERFPQLSDLRESGSLEQDADAVMFLHSDYLNGITQDENGYSTEGVRQLVIRKWRNGVPNIIIDMDFDGPKMSLKEKGHVWTLAKQDDETPF